MTSPAASRPGWRGIRWAAFFAVLGPGLVVMLADTDVGSVITAAQSGAQWGYRLLIWQLLLVPVLYVVQELTVRLGVFTGRGHGELIREHFGTGWAWLSAGGLAVASLGAVVTEFSGVAGVGELFGVPRAASLALVAGFLLIVVWTGSYRRVERVAILLGLFELAFVWVALRAPFNGAQVGHEMFALPLHRGDYWYLVAANIGAVLMPWMVFFQQSSVVEKGLRAEDLRAARWDTALGAVATQVIMAAVLVATAAGLGTAAKGAALDNVPQIAQAFTRALGPMVGRVLFGLGLTGSALVATIVVTLTAARALAEALGADHRLDQTLRQAPWFYGVYMLALGAAAIVVASGVDLVRVSVGVQVMNALLLPVVLGFLYLLARRLPPAVRLRGAYEKAVLLIIVLTTGLGVYSAIAGMF